MRQHQDGKAIYDECFSGHHDPRKKKRVSDRIICMTLGETLSEIRFLIRGESINKSKNRAIVGH